MTTVHALAGLPRAGSTLLGNLLAQHPAIHVSGTSALPQVVGSIRNTLSVDMAARSDLSEVPGSYERFLGVYRAVIKSWYADLSEPHVIDKGRGWLVHQELLTAIDPTAVVIVCVRDPRDVFASVVSRDKESAAFYSDLGQTIEQMGFAAFGEGGLIGTPIRLAEDAIRRNSPVEWVEYEQLVLSPIKVLNRLVKSIGVEPIEWDTENVRSVATDNDALYLNKYPHDGSGPVRPRATSWRELLHPEVAANCVAGFPLYMKSFGYEA